MRKTTKAIIMTILMMVTIFYTCFSVTAGMTSKKIIKTTDEGLGNIEGTVNQWGDGPLENAYVYVAGGHISLQEFNISVVLNQDQTNATGHYFIRDLPEGKYTLLVLRNGFGKQDKWVPALRHTTVYAGETTVENFNLKKLGRSRSNIIFENFPQIYKILIYRLFSKITI